jgi:hypothetical protein
MRGVLQMSRKENSRTARPASVEERARELLARNCHFRGRVQQLTMEERDGVLIVCGRVPSFYLKQVLQTALRDVDGVQQVDNRVQVASPTGLTD